MPPADTPHRGGAPPARAPQPAAATRGPPPPPPPPRHPTRHGRSPRAPRQVRRGGAAPGLQRAPPLACAAATAGLPSSWPQRPSPLAPRRCTWWRARRRGVARRQQRGAWRRCTARGRMRREGGEGMDVVDGMCDGRRGGRQRTQPRTSGLHSTRWTRQRTRRTRPRRRRRRAACGRQAACIVTMA